MPELKSFEEFWPYYLRAHSQPETKALHIAGTTVAAASLAAWLVTRRSKFLGLALAGSYGPAWFGHFAFEGNSPATFDHPLWSLRADLLMYRLWLDGKLDDEVKRIGMKTKNSAKASAKPAA